MAAVVEWRLGRRLFVEALEELCEDCLTVAVYNACSDDAARDVLRLLKGFHDDVLGFIGLSELWMRPPSSETGLLDAIFCELL